MRGFWRFWGMLTFLGAVNAFAKFEETSSPKVDSKAFGGLSDEELKELERQMQSEYTSAILKHIKKFDEGDISSKYGANGRNSGFKEAHVGVDGMVEHEGASNAAESAIEAGALGKTGLSGQQRIKAIEDEMQKTTKKLDKAITQTGPDGKSVTYNYRNEITGKLQVNTFDISPVIYDAGPAHGSNQDAPHRSYGVKVDVRKKSEENASQYATKVIQDATLAPGKQPNLDLLHKHGSKLEQDKYIAMASDAMALRATRMAGFKSTEKENNFISNEFRQIAIDSFAKAAGDVKKGEELARQEIAKRVSEKKVLSTKNLCLGSSGAVVPNQGRSNCVEGSTTSAPPGNMSSLAFAQKVITKIDPNADAAKIALYENQIKEQFKKADGSGYEDRPKSESDIANAIKGMSLAEISKFASKDKVDQYYKEAESNLSSDDQTKMAEYKKRLEANKCLDYTGFCFSGLGDKNNGVTKGSKITSTGGSVLVDEYEFQKVEGGDDDFLGDKFVDTREMIFNKFAYAYNQPLDQWGKILGEISYDFSEASDANLKTGTFAKGQDGKVRDGKLYKEFQDMHKYAMDVANRIKNDTDKRLIERLKSAGASPEQIAKIRPNYSANFDPKKLSFMQLFGQNKDRDAVMMDWRKGVGNKFYNPYIKQKTTPPPPAPDMAGAASPARSPTMSGRN